MKKNWKSFLALGIGYYFLIIFFALVYWLMFYCNTSSFYISEQYNERVNNMSRQHDMDRIYEIADREEIPFTLDRFNQKLKPLSDSLLWLHYQHIPALNKQDTILRDSLDKCIDRFAESRNREIELYKSEALKVLQDSIVIVKQEIVMLEMEGNSDIRLLSSMYLKLAELNVKLAHKIQVVTNVIVENYSFLGNKELGDTITFLNQTLIDKSVEISKNERKKHDLFNKYFDLTNSFHHNRQEKVGFWDFLHFSTLIATSNSYGDILPNNDCTRRIVTIQLFVGIICLAFLLDRIIKML